MNKACKHCQQQFNITQQDLAFYENVSPVFAGKKHLINPPTLCPLCRQQRRQTRRNERKLYNRKCDATGKQIVSIYHSESPYQVFESAIWWSDQFDGKKHGRDFDFSKPFFEQFYQLQLAVPRPALFNKTTENSDYTNHTDQVKNCYLIMNGGLDENCMYGNWIVSCRDCVDCSYIEECELCYETNYSLRCYNCNFVTHSENCRDSSLLFDCKGVSNSLMCVGLRNKEYCVLNQQLTPEEFKIQDSKFKEGGYKEVEEAKRKFEQLLLMTPHRGQFIVNSESCSGENIYNSKNCQNCFYVHNSQDAKYCFNTLNITDGYDVYEAGINCEMQIETHACNRGKYLGFCSASYDNTNIWYCDLCHNSKDLFGCIGLRNAQYCIFNKQYTKESYEELVDKIIEHMKKTNEWSEFFPGTYSPFSYNETLANETFPLTKEQALQRNWPWHEDSLGSTYQGEKVQIVDNIKEVTNAILEKILGCESCHKHYRLIRQELEFYRKQNLPLPRVCIDCRHRRRTMESTNVTLFSRQCAKCNQNIQTIYKPDDSKIIYCEECYLKRFWI